MFALVFLFACTVTDDLGQQCGWGEAFSDGESTFCPQADAPQRCEEIAAEAAFYAWVCLGVVTEQELLTLQLEEELHCDSAVVVLPEADACLEQLDDRSCPSEEALPAACNGVIVSG